MTKIIIYSSDWFSPKATLDSPKQSSQAQISAKFRIMFIATDRA